MKKRVPRVGDWTSVVGRLFVGRAVIVLRFWRDLPLEEIANRLALPLGTVKSRLHYGLRAMRGVIEPAALVEVSQ